MTPSRNAVRLLLRFRSAIGINRNIAPTTERCFSCSTPSPVSLPGTKQAYKPFLQQNATRSFASSTDQAEQSGLGREMQIRFVRIVAIGMILVAATKVVPLMFQSTVPHAIQLCQASEPIMQRSAARRVSKLAENDAELQDLVAGGVCPLLLGMLKPDVDPGRHISKAYPDVLTALKAPAVATAVLSAVKEISRLAEGREGLRSAGAHAVLSTGLQEQWFRTQHDAEEASKISRWLTSKKSLPS